MRAGERSCKRIAWPPGNLDAVNHMKTIFRLLEERMNRQFTADVLRAVEAYVGLERGGCD